MKPERLVLILSAIIFFSTVIYLLQLCHSKNNSKITALETFINEQRIDYDDIISFNNGKFSPLCCPSTYSSDRGCLCVTDKLKKIIATRGNNRAGSSANGKLYEDI
jgi:hypothetical protein